MNVNKLDYELDFANNSGSTLNIEELTHLQLSVANLNANENFDEIYFWGRIRGIDKDYYIVMGVRFKERVNFPERCFFWCYNNFVLAPLNSVTSEVAEFLASFNGYFSGQHDKVLKAASYEDLPSSVPVIENGKVSTKLDDRAIILRGNRPKAITELDRLSFTVQTIEHECAVVKFLIPNPGVGGGSFSRARKSPPTKIISNPGVGGGSFSRVRQSPPTKIISNP